MRRALIAITGLAAGTTALVVLKGGPGAGQATAGDVPAASARPGRLPRVRPVLAVEQLIAEEGVNVLVLLARMIAPGNVAFQAELVHRLLQFDPQPRVMYPQPRVRVLIDRHIPLSVRHEDRNIVLRQMRDG